jgi:hypothetical protein
MKRDFDESMVNRHPAGTSKGGEFAPKGSAAAPVERKLKAKQSLVERMRDPEGGFTYQPVTEDEPKDGFAVSVFEGRSESFDPDTVTFDTLGDYYIRNLEVLEDVDNYIGAWHFEGKLFLDVSRVEKSLERAKELARQHDQIGIYNLSTGEEIILDRHAKSGGAA